MSYETVMAHSAEEWTDFLEQARSKPMFVSVGEAAKWTGYHPDTIRRFIREGRLPAMRIGSGAKANFRIPISALADVFSQDDAASA